MTSLSASLLSVSTLSPLDHLSNSHQFPLSVVRLRPERWGGGLGIPVLVLSLNYFLLSLWLSVSSSVSKGAETDDLRGLVQLSSV